MLRPCSTETASRHPAWQTIRALNVADDVYRRKEALEEIRQRLLHFLKDRGVTVRKGDAVDGVIAFAADARLLVADIVPVRRALQLRNEVRYNDHIPSVDEVAAAADVVEAFCERFVERSPAPGCEPAWPPMASIDAVTDEPGVVCNGTAGVRLSVRATVAGMQGREATIAMVIAAGDGTLLPMPGGTSRMAIDVTQQSVAVASAVQAVTSELHVAYADAALARLAAAGIRPLVYFVSIRACLEGQWTTLRTAAPRPLRMPTVTLKGPVSLRPGTGVRTARVVVVQKRVVTGDSP
jgi:hypothetical protein